ncbi:triosephosphate isomerase [Candidatus Curtissbacteria bacterium]|nr:triosephosphate isomerase [Candidatus Curtissbacteria bacterium]
MSKSPFVVANHKANKTWEEVRSWLVEISNETSAFPGTIVFCPSAPFLASTYSEIKKINSSLQLSAQDISKFEQGAYTGEFAATQIKDFCTYSIIGHSERRANFNESENTLSQKVKNAKTAGIEPIFCVQSVENEIPTDVKIVAYEPVFAIGTGNPDTPANVKDIAKKLKEKGEFMILYGGSVDAQNVKSFLEPTLIDGVLIGASNSLDPKKFIAIVQNAA